MNVLQQLPQQPVRSKGQATVQPYGGAAFPTTVRDISPAGIGVLASQSLNPGTFVHIDIHGHGAEGVVTRSDADGAGFYIDIILDQSLPPEAPAA